MAPVLSFSILPGLFGIQKKHRHFEYFNLKDVIIRHLSKKQDLLIFHNLTPMGQISVKGKIKGAKSVLWLFRST